MIHLLSRSILLGVLLALVPTWISAGGLPPGLPAGGVPTCPRGTSYNVEMISGAGPFAPRNDPFIKHPVVPTLTYNLLNTGATMPHLVVSVDSRGTFTPGRVTATVNTGHGVYSPHIRLIAHTGSVSVWDFAGFPAGAEELIRIQMHLNRRCCYSAFVRSFGNLTRDGGIDPRSAVNGGASGGSSASS